jgi:poly(3-hydroxybutyrate) depolymerase
MSHEHIAFKDMTKDQQQLFIDFQFKELERHLEDVFKIKEDLATAKEKYGIKPRRVYVGKWIDVE